MNRRKIEVLEKLKNVLKFVELYPSKWFIGNVPIPASFVFWPLLFMLMVLQILSVWFCKAFEMDLAIVSGALCGVLAITQISAIYTDLRCAKTSLVTAVDSLQRLVQQSKCQSTFRLFEFVSFISLRTVSSSTDDTNNSKWL